MNGQLRMLLLGVIATSGLVGCGTTATQQTTVPIPVRASYRGLENQSVAVLVRRGETTERPFLSYELGASLSLRLQDRVPGIRVISPDDIRNYQEQNPHWTYRPYAEVARALKADRLVVVLLREYRIQDDRRVSWQGRIEAQVDVIEINPKNSEKVSARFSVLTQYPNQTKALGAIHNELSLRLATGQEFSIAVANKFHDHALWRPKP